MEAAFQAFQVVLPDNTGKSGSHTSLEPDDLVFMRSNIPVIGSGIVIMREVTAPTPHGFMFVPLLFNDGTGFKSYLRTPDGEAVVRLIRCSLGLCGYDLVECGNNRYRVVERENTGATVQLVPTVPPATTKPGDSIASPPTGVVNEASAPPAATAPPATPDDQGAPMRTIALNALDRCFSAQQATIKNPRTDSQSGAGNLFGGPAFQKPLGALPSYA